MTKQEWMAQHKDFVGTLGHVTEYIDSTDYSKEPTHRRRPVTPCSKAREQARLLRQLAKHVERAAKLETAQVRAQRQADRLAQQLQDKRDVCDTLARYLKDTEQAW